jgi:uncharacterized protein (DUF305 family)
MQATAEKSGFQLPGRGLLPRTRMTEFAKFLAWKIIATLSCMAPISVYAQQSKPDTAPIIQPGAPGNPSKQLPPSMIMHHSQAVEMTALIPSHTENPEIHLLGARISRSQSDEMNFMKRWLIARGQPVSMAMPGMPDMDMKGNPMQAMPGMLTPEQMTALRAARGAEFDQLFLTGMIQHHNGALIMVKSLFDTPGAGQDADLFDFATDADNTQRAEIRIMQNMLKEKR